MTVETTVVQFFSNTDVLVFFFGLAVSFSYLAFLLAFTTKITKKMSILVNMIFIGLLYSAGALSQSFGFLIALITASLITLLYRRQFLSTGTDRDAIMITYIVFFVSLISFEGIMGLAVSGSFGSQNAGQFVNCGSFIGFFICGFNAVKAFFALFNFFTPIGLLNTILMIPFTYFLVSFGIAKIKSGG